MFVDSIMPKSQTIIEDSSHDKEIIRLRARLCCLQGTNSPEKQELLARLWAIDHFPIPKPAKVDQTQGKKVVRFG